MEEITVYLEDSSSRVISALNPPLHLEIDNIGYTIKDRNTDLIAHFPLRNVLYVETNFIEKVS